MLQHFQCKLLKSLCRRALVSDYLFWIRPGPGINMRPCPKRYIYKCIFTDWPNPEIVAMLVIHLFFCLACNTSSCIVLISFFFLVSLFNLLIFYVFHSVLHLLIQGFATSALLIFGVVNSLMFCALQDIYGYPWSPLTRCQQHLPVLLTYLLTNFTRYCQTCPVGWKLPG